MEVWFSENGRVAIRRAIGKKTDFEVVQFLNAVDFIHESPDYESALCLAESFDEFDELKVCL